MFSFQKDPDTCGRGLKEFVKPSDLYSPSFPRTIKTKCFEAFPEFGNQSFPSNMTEKTCEYKEKHAHAGVS